jgi:hypothetical protein
MRSFISGVRCGINEAPPALVAPPTRRRSHMPQNRERRDFDPLLDQYSGNIAKQAQLDIGMGVIGSPTLSEYRQNQICCMLSLQIGRYWHSQFQLELECRSKLQRAALPLIPHRHSGQFHAKKDSRSFPNSMEPLNI